MVGQAIVGDTGAKIVGSAYDVAVVAANLYVDKVGLKQAGKLPVKVNINNVANNPLNEFVTIGSRWCYRAILLHHSSIWLW